MQWRLEEYTKSIIGQSQAGFVKGRSTSDQIFILKESLAKYYEYNKECFCLFVDFKKAYDSLYRIKIWEKMKKFGIPDKLVKMASLSVKNTRCKVKIDGKTSHMFDINTGVRQGDNISPLLFNISLEKAIQKVKDSELGIKLGTNINILAFADDVVIIAENKEDLKKLTETLIRETEYVGLKINEAKTKYLCITKRGMNQHENEPLKIQNFKFQNTNQFSYLGVIINNTNTEDNEIQQRLNSANKSFHACSKLLQSKLLSHSTKIRIYKTIIRSTLLYNAENWIMSQKIEKKCITFENKILRKIYGPALEEGIW